MLTDEAWTMISTLIIAVVVLLIGGYSIYSCRHDSLIIKKLKELECIVYKNNICLPKNYYIPDYYKGRIGYEHAIHKACQNKLFLAKKSKLEINSMFEEIRNEITNDLQSEILSESASKLLESIRAILNYNIKSRQSETIQDNLTIVHIVDSDILLLEKYSEIFTLNEQNPLKNYKKDKEIFQKAVSEYISNLKKLKLFKSKDINFSSIKMRINFMSGLKFDANINNGKSVENWINFKNIKYKEISEQTFQILKELRTMKNRATDILMKQTEKIPFCKFIFCFRIAMVNYFYDKCQRISADRNYGVTSNSAGRYPGTSQSSNSSFNSNKDHSNFPAPSASSAPSAPSAPPLIYPLTSTQPGDHLCKLYQKLSVTEEDEGTPPSYDNVMKQKKER